MKRNIQKIIGATELQRCFRAVFDEVAYNQTPYVLTRGSRRETIIIPYEAFLRFQALQEEEVVARFDRLVAHMAEQNAAYSEVEIAADVVVARDELGC